MKFVIPQKFKLSTLLYNKKFAITLSIVLAFVLWLGIAINENPIRERTFNNLSASITLENTVAAEMNLDFTSDISTQKFTIKVSGPNYVVSSLRAEDFSLNADTTAITSIGEKTINIIPTSDKSGFTMSVYPSSISVSVDRFDDISFDIAAEVGGEGTTDGFRKDTATVIDATDSKIIEKIKINGPSTILDKITAVKAKANATNMLTATETFNAEIYIYGNNPDKEMYRIASDGSVYDGNNTQVTNSKLSLSTTNIKVVQKVVKFKTVECRPSFENMPSVLKLEDIPYSFVQDNSNKKLVTISGDPDAVDKIEFIELLIPGKTAEDVSKKIDIRNITIGTKPIKLVPQLPAGISIDDIDGLDFTLEFDFDNFTEVTITGVSDIRVINKAADLTATISTKNVSFRICGPKNVLRNISKSNFYAVVDLKDKQVGSFKVDAVLNSDVYKNVWQVGACPPAIGELN